MDKFVKILSTESGEVTSTDNLRNFRIPEGDVYSLRDSYVNINCSMDYTETTAGGGVGVYLAGVDWVKPDSNKPHFDNVAVVKNCSLRNSRQGVLESIRRNDVLKENMAIVSSSVGETLDRSYLNINQLVSPINQQQYSLFNSINKVGGVKSINNEVTPIQIRLSDLFDFCSTDEYDTVRGGELNIHMELNRDKLVARQLMKTADIKPALLTFRNVVVGDTKGNSITVGKTDSDVTTRIRNLVDSPYYVGQKLLISAVGTGTNPSTPNNVTDAPVVISSIEWTRQNAGDATKAGQLTLTFETDWGVSLSGDQGYKTVSAKIAEATPALRVNECQLVLKKLDQNEKRNYSDINYTTFTCEEGNGNNSTNYQNLFTVEPRSTQAFMCFADGEDGLVSTKPIQDFRCALNNIDVTDRNVDVGSPLYYDRLSQTLRGMGRRLNNTQLNGGISAPVAYSSVFNNANAVTNPLVASLFETENNKFLQVRVGCSGGVKAFQLFKAIPRVFSY